ncbi:MAG: hypothetical protein HS108_00650 [Planctomycetes bacterium]|nr:hypothetical protein [Planctomycetota bacterium]MCL4730358.1 hypothetical protein [Planctomycetota bacterium]
MPARVLLLLLLTAAPLAANDMVVAAPGGRAAWLLLEPPPGQATPGGHEHGDDPGLFAPDVLGRAAAGRPVLDLWRYDGDSARYERITRMAPGSTLYALFAVGGRPFVLWNRSGPGVPPTTVLRADTPWAGAPPEAAAVLASAEFADAPSVSPDGTRLVLRAFRGSGSAVLRVYDTAAWTLLAESAAGAWSRPVWIGNGALACLSSDAGIARVSLGERGAIPRVNDNPPPQAGTLWRLDLQDRALAAVALLAGEFPPETFTRALGWDVLGRALVLARRDGEHVMIEQRPPEPGAVGRELARFDHFRGLVTGGLRVRFAGVRDRRVQLGELSRLQPVTVPAWPRRGARVVAWVRRGPGRVVLRDAPDVSASGLGGLVDPGRGLYGLVEPVANPDHALAGQPICLHTLRMPDLPGLDSMRNPHNLARLSALVRRFGQLDAAYPRGVPSTLLAFEMTITMPNVDPKKGTYVELYHGDGRGGKGRIRTEDNLSGDWLMNSMDGAGDAETDWHYSCAAIKTGQVQKQAPSRAGKVYDDLVTQLEARKLLLLSGVARAADQGGLVFLGRGTHTDLGTGVTMRVWRYLRLGRELAGGGREAVVLKFVADLPQGSRGTWRHPHSLLHARLRFAMANGRDAAQTDLSFAPDQIVELPNLTEPDRPALLLPAEFRIHEWDEKTGKPVERLHARAKSGEFAHPPELVAGGRLKPGYFVPALDVPVTLRRAADAQFQQLQRPGPR